VIPGGQVHVFGRRVWEWPSDSAEKWTRPRPASGYAERGPGPAPETGHRSPGGTSGSTQERPPAPGPAPDTSHRSQGGVWSVLRPPGLALPTRAGRKDGPLASTAMALPKCERKRQQLPRPDNDPIGPWCSPRFVFVDDSISRQGRGFGNWQLNLDLDARTESLSGGRSGDR